MSPWPGACAVVCVLLVLVAIVGTVREFLARRNERQLADHIRLRNGMKTAARMGWLPDDCQ